jgi:hypothetical protein
MDDNQYLDEMIEDVPSEFIEISEIFENDNQNNGIYQIELLYFSLHYKPLFLIRALAFVGSRHTIKFFFLPSIRMISSKEPVVSHVHIFLTVF